MYLILDRERSITRKEEVTARCGNKRRHQTQQVIIHVAYNTNGRMEKSEKFKKIKRTPFPIAQRINTSKTRK